MTTGNRDDDRCAYVFKPTGFCCGATREQHDRLGMDSHDFTPSLSQPALESGEWGIFEHYQNAAGERTRILDASGILVAEAQTAQHATQIVADHSSKRLLVAALEDLVCQLPSDERLADFNLDLAERALTAATTTHLDEGGRG